MGEKLVEGRAATECQERALRTGKNDKWYGVKNPLLRKTVAGIIIIVFALLSCFHFKIKYGRKVKFRASYTLFSICPSLALFRPHLKYQ